MKFAWTAIQVERKPAANEPWPAFPKRCQVSTVMIGATGTCRRVLLDGARERPLRLTGSR